MRRSTWWTYVFLVVQWWTAFLRVHILRSKAISIARSVGQEQPRRITNSAKQTDKNTAPTHAATAVTAAPATTLSLPLTPADTGLTVIPPVLRTTR